MIFTHNGYGLIFVKQYSNDTHDYYRTDNKLTIKCYRGDLTNPHDVRYIYVKKYKKHNDLGYYVFEDMNRLTNQGLNYKYSYLHNGSTIYGFKTENTNEDSMISGVMFENIENLDEANKYSLDDISPNLYYNKTIEEIANIVGSNVSGYFSLVQNKSNEINL